MAQPIRSAARELMSVARGRTPTHSHLRGRLVALYLVTLAIDLVGSALILWLERDEPGTGIRHFGDAIFWTTTQLLTVSSQLPNPISPGGRVVDVFLQAWAISVVALLAGSFAAFFQRRGFERHPLDLERRPLDGEG